MQAYTAKLLCAIVIFVSVRRQEAGDINPLIKLWDLHAEHCHTESLCSFRRQTRHSRSQNTTCCRECTCEAECTELGTCCPDYHLLNKIGRYVSYNVTEFSERLKNIDLTKDTNEHVKCIETNGQNYIKTDWKSTAYKMIARCPLQFRDVEIHRKCAEPSNISTFEPDLFIPVTSKKTLRTYRNYYCFRCYEEVHFAKDFIEWHAIMYCRHSHQVNLIAVSPHDFVKTFIHTEAKTKDCRMEIVPEETGYQLPDKCDVVDFKTCPTDSDKYLQEICKSFLLPVKHFSSVTLFQTYKNIACYLCRSDKPFVSDCNISIPQPLEYGLQMYFRENRDLTVKLFEEAEGETVLSVTGLTDRDDTCGPGYIQIISSHGEPKCARVLCPLNYFPHQGSCLPVFSVIYGAYYTAMLDVRRPQIYDQQTLDTIRNTYMKRIFETAAIFFVKFSWGIWEIDNTYDVLAVSFNVVLGSNTYNDIMSFFGQFLNAICSVDIVTESEAFRISISQTRNPKFSSLKGMYSLKPMPESIHGYTELDSSLMLIQLFNTHLCYRVTVPISEKKYYIENRLHEESIQYTESGDMKVCIDDVNNNITDRKSVYKFAHTCVQTTDDFMKEYKINNRNNDQQTWDKTDGATVSGSGYNLFDSSMSLAVVVVAVAPIFI